MRKDSQPTSRRQELAGSEGERSVGNEQLARPKQSKAHRAKLQPVQPSEVELRDDMDANPEHPLAGLSKKAREESKATLLAAVLAKVARKLNSKETGSRSEGAHVYTI